MQNNIYNRRNKTTAAAPILNPPFGSPRTWTGDPSWQTLGHGLIALCDGPDPHMVAPGMIIGVKDDGKGNPAICRYWYADSMSPARRRNPLPYQLLLNASYRDKLAVLETDVNLTDVLTYAVKLFPGLETYTAEDWWSEWGCKYDPHTNTARFAA